MGLLDEVEAETRYGGNACPVGAALDGLTPKQRSEWEEVLASAAPGTAIARVSAKHGLNLKAPSIQRHRRGECQCPR